MKASAPAGADPFGLASRLVDVGNADTVYRDVYLHRARALLAGVLSAEDFRAIEQQKVEAATLPLMIGRAMEKADWPRVKELSGRVEALRRAVEGKRRQMETARGVYVVNDVRLDPFSPGLQVFTRLGEKNRLALRTRGIEHLAELEQSDVSWKSFYEGRRTALQALALTASEQTPTAAASVDLREEAQRALKVGDMKNLARLAEGLMTQMASPKGAPASHEPETGSAVAPAPRAPDILTAYTDATLRGRGGSGWPPVVSNLGPSWPRFASTPGTLSSLTSRAESVSRRRRSRPAPPRHSVSDSRCS
jgi:hypothetical protein